MVRTVLGDTTASQREDCLDLRKVIVNEGDGRCKSHGGVKGNYVR